MTAHNLQLTHPYNRSNPVISGTSCGRSSTLYYQSWVWIKSQLTVCANQVQLESRSQTIWNKHSNVQNKLDSLHEVHNTFGQRYCMEFIYTDNLIYIIYFVVTVCILVMRENETGFDACFSDRWCDNRFSQEVGQLESNLTEWWVPLFSGY